MSTQPSLRVWLYGIAVAELTAVSRTGKMSCRYLPDALQRWDRNSPILSCSLPMAQRRITDAGSYFRGMLPEGTVLQAMAQEAGVTTTDTFALLARFGRDVAGAAVISAEPGVPRLGHAVPYSSGGLADEVGGLETRPLALYDDSELSLPGLQNKMLLVREHAGWARPAHGFASTHILKVEDRRFPGLVSMEAACLGVARAVGLTSVDAEVLDLDGLKAIIVSRFDRVPGLSPVDASTPPSVRIHQEDVCQALGVDAEAARGKGKYEEAGGPRFSQVAGLLDRYSRDPARQLERLLTAATFTVAIGNADAHGKNVSLLHSAPGVVELAPLYDTVPTAMWPKLRDHAAMRINGRLGLGQVSFEDLVIEARSWRMAEKVATRVVTETAERVRDAARGEGTPEQLTQFVVERTERLLADASR